MTLNIMNDDPEYLITHLLLPARERFNRVGNRFMFNSYSFGVVPSKNGPEIVDEAINYIREINAKYTMSPVRWSDVLGDQTSRQLTQVQNKLLDLK